MKGLNAFKFQSLCSFVATRWKLDHMTSELSQGLTTGSSCAKNQSRRGSLNQPRPTLISNLPPEHVEESNQLFLAIHLRLTAKNSQNRS